MADLIHTLQCFAQDAGDFDANKHPRRSNGQFSPSNQGKPGSSNGKKSSKGHLFTFVVGGVNSKHEKIYITSPSYKQAAYQALLRAANGQKRYLHRTWARPVAVNSVSIEGKYGIIEGDRYRYDKNIDRTEDELKRTILNPADRERQPKEGNSAESIPDQSRTRSVLRGGDGKGVASGPECSGSVSGGVQPQPIPGRVVGYGTGGATPSVTATSGRLYQPTLPLTFAQDSKVPPKKIFFVALVKSLHRIASPDTDMSEEKKVEKREERRAETHSGASVHARVGVSERVPVGLQENIPAMTPRGVRDMIRENCSLIKTVEKDRIPGIERRIKRIYEKRKTGQSTPSTLARYLEKDCDLEPWQADRIVRDQMNKYDRAAELAELKRKGVRLVRWVHGGSNEPREYHIRHWDGHSGLRNGRPNGLAGFVFSLDNPPIIDPKTGERGYPGDLIMCSCHLEAAE